MDVQVAHYTDKGTRRPVDEDSLVIRTARTVNGPLVMAAVCDGMGGRAHGDLASSTAVHELSDWFDERLPILLQDGYDLPVLRGGIELVLRRISTLLENHAARHRQDMGTTLTMLLLYDGHCVTANVGDSRIYEISRADIRQLTKDHTLVQREADSGLLTPEQAETDRRRNILYQCLGETLGLAPDILEQDVRPGSVFLLCSDGFRHQLPPREMREVLWKAAGKRRGGMEQALSTLARRAMDRGETDNITAVTVRMI